MTDPASGVEQYTYDTNHRMLTVRDKRNNVMVTNVYDANGRVQTQTYADTRTNTFAYTLNGSGQATQLDITDERGFVRRIAFNGAGYPVTVTRALGQAEQQIVQRTVDATTNLMMSKTDALGRVTVSGTNRQFLYDGLNPIQERSGGGVSASILTGLGIDEFFKRTEGANSEHYLTDALGSTLRLTDSSAVKVVDYTYQAYGETAADASSTNAFQYAGRENDGTGLYYYRERYHHPVLGRFIQEDPVGLLGGLNLYAYVDGNPISFTDPLGLAKPSPQAQVEAAIARGDTQALSNLIEGGSLTPAEQAVAQKGLERLATTAEKIISNELKGSVNREFPSQLRGSTLQQILQGAQKGDPGCIKAKKLLNDLRFKK